MKNIIHRAVDSYRDTILEALAYIGDHPETGYREVKTSAYLEEKFIALGYDLIKPEGITGFCTVVDTGREGPEVLVLAELDSIICPAHPKADPVTGAAHSCGHHAQCAALLGIAAALRDPDVLAPLSGRIRLCAVPAEELLEIGYRRSLQAEGRIRYLGGKSEFLSRGLFDGVDMALMVHTSRDFRSMLGSVGCLAKNVIYKGVASHAGGSPWNGRNALYAATCGLNAVNAIRESFMDQDLIRVHPIMTGGGDMVNAIPATATLESYVRGRTYEAIVNANRRVNQALIGAALSIDTNVDIVDIPGYAPLVNAPDMITLAKEAADAMIPEEGFELLNSYSTGSTDMGDLSCIMPVVHPYAGGAMGASHGNDYTIVDPDRACVKSAKWQLMMLSLLLENGAARARSILDGFVPQFASAEEFLAFQDSLCASGDRIRYESGRAEVTL